MISPEAHVEVPDFSIEERDRRFRLVRDFLRDRGLDGLVVAGLKAGEPLDQYLTNEPPGGIVVFPRDAEPVRLCPMVTELVARSPEDRARSWIRDTRPGARGTAVGVVLEELGLARGRVGVVGLLGALRTDWEGWIPFRTWDRVVRGAPHATFEDVTAEYGELILAKSDAELSVVRRAAAILERASQTMVAAVRPGVSERDVYAEVRDVLDAEGAYASMLMLESGWGLQGEPRWLWQSVPPRVMKEGDIVVAELFAWVGGLEAQVQVTVAIPPVAPETRECALLARMAYEQGLRSLRAGRTFEQAAEAMEGELIRYGIWHPTPLIHSMNPMACIGRTGVNLMYVKGLEERYPGVGGGRIRGGHVVLRPGMTFEVEPNACKGRRRVNIGGTVIVTAGAPEELNEVATRMRVVGE